MRLAYTDDNAITATIEFDRWSSYDPSRACWHWTIETDTEHGPEILAEATDLETAGYRPVEALDALASFLGAWAEAMNPTTGGPGPSENAGLFPAHLAELSVDWSTFADEIADAIGKDRADH